MMFYVKGCRPIKNLWEFKVFALGLHSGTKQAQDVPRCPQDGPRWAQDGPKLAQDGPKMAPSWPKMASIWPKLPPISPKMPQDGPKMFQDGLGRGRDFQMLETLNLLSQRRSEEWSAAGGSPQGSQSGRTPRNGAAGTVLDLRTGTLNRNSQQFSFRRSTTAEAQTARAP